MEKKGIDISKWNKIDSYKAMRRAGVEFAILKVNNAGDTPDSRFFEHVAGCGSAGIPVIGGYNYCYADTVDKAKWAAEAFVSISKPQEINTMILDLEDKSIMNLGGRLIKIVHAYRKIAKDAGMKFVIYTGAHFYNPCLKPYAKEIKDIPVWWARYPSMAEMKIHAPVPEGRNLPKDIKLCGWQYSSKGVIDGAQGYIDLDVWWEGNIVVNPGTEITPLFNPFAEPIHNVKLGTTGNDADWVQWYLWRFGKYVDELDVPDVTKIDGAIDADDVEKIKETQALLGLDPDGIVGKITRSVWKKII